MKNLIVTCILIFSTFILSAQLKHALRDENGHHVIGRSFVVVTNDSYFNSNVYSTTFTIDALPTDGNLFINLGKVSVMAELRINGKEAGGVWMAPYRLNVSGLLKQGENTLEIEVVNLWRNRLIKDKMLPENERYTWTVEEDIKPGEEPHSSGLLGPLTIEMQK